MERLVEFWKQSRKKFKAKSRNRTGEFYEIATITFLDSLKVQESENEREREIRRETAKAQRHSRLLRPFCHAALHTFYSCLLFWWFVCPLVATIFCLSLPEDKTAGDISRFFPFWYKKSSIDSFESLVIVWFLVTFIFVVEFGRWLVNFLSCRDRRWSRICSTFRSINYISHITLHPVFWISIHFSLFGCKKCIPLSSSLIFQVLSLDRVYFLLEFSCRVFVDCRPDICLYIKYRSGIFSYSDI